MARQLHLKREVLPLLKVPTHTSNTLHTGQHMGMMSMILSSRLGRLRSMGRDKLVLRVVRLPLQLERWIEAMYAG
jgi:hypothetical protein